MIDYLKNVLYLDDNGNLCINREDYNDFRFRFCVNHLLGNSFNDNLLRHWFNSMVRSKL